MRIVGPVLCTLLTAVLATPAQVNVAAAIPADARFEVATIKPGTPGQSAGIRFTVSFTRVTTANTSVADLLKYAYGLHADQLIGGPDQLMHQGYAIQALVSADTPTTPNADLLKQMLRNLLADRFGLKLHTESRELPVYLLTVASPAIPLKPTEEPVPMPTGGYGNGLLSVHHGSPRDLAAYLQRFVTDRPVVDRTNIQGEFDMDLHFTPEDAPATSGDAVAQAGAGGAGAQYPGLFTAIRQQLGLRLNAGKAQVNVMVVDHVTDPTAN